MYNPAFQTEPNGPLTAAFRDRVRCAKAAHGLSEQALADRIGLSRSLVSQLLTADKRIRSVRLPALVQVVESLEQSAAEWARPAELGRPGEVLPFPPTAHGTDDVVAQLVRLAAAHGFSVTIRAGM